MLPFFDRAKAACLSGIADTEPKNCKFFVEYKPPGTNVIDERITSRFANVTPSSPIRSYALVIAIDSYPQFASADDRDLPPAKHDADNLIAFLKEQQFDEIIFLHNADATKDNINYMIDVYLNQQLDIFGQNSRVLVAHTGHGGPGSAVGAPGNIILANATGARDYPNVYALNDLAPKLRNIAGKSYQFLALLGSCYSGGIFNAQIVAGSNDWYPSAPGGHAVSSTPHDDLAYGLGGSNGSIFFDSLIAGVRNGQGDTLYAGWSAVDNGDLRLLGGGIVRLGALMSYISGKIDSLGINPKNNKPFPQILLGKVSSNERNGAFFFLGPPKTKTVSFSRAYRPTTIATNDTGSSLFNNSDVKVFSPPDSYVVSGVDVSHFNGKIDWATAAKTIKFAYMKATESVTLKDELFASNWAGAAASGLRRGAYHVFDFCEDITRQFDNVSRSVPADPAAMPVAIDLPWLGGPQNPRQKGCADPADTRRKLLAFAQMLQKFYGKSPIFFANQSAVSDLLTDDFIAYPIWLQMYDTAGADPLASLKLKGRNPWTFWQFTSKGRVPGIPGNVDRDVFFGTEAALASYVEGRGNPALRAAQR